MTVILRFYLGLRFSQQLELFILYEYKCTMYVWYRLVSLLQKHEVPLSAVPCLQYRRALEAEALNKLQVPTAISDPAAANVTNGKLKETYVQSVKTCTRGDPKKTGIDLLRMRAF
jgi:hypothetical protein